MNAPAIGFELQEKCLKLKEAILSNHPSMPGMLRELHKILRDQPENVTLAGEENIQIVVQGLIKQTGVEFATSAASKKSANAKIKADPAAALGL